eukprot:Skav204618  [mRNA]  locus=scaffold1712:166543:170025:- [translate_table: standard]
MSSMKFSIYVLLALGVSDTCADSNECDATSHLATRSQVKKVSQAQDILFSELRLNLSPALLEISGPPGASFTGCIWFIGTPVDVVGPISPFTTTFDANGLLVQSISGFPEPRTWFLSESCPTSSLTTIDNLDVSTAGQIYDSIGIPSAQSDESILENRRLQLNVPGTDLKFTGKRPDLVFRDASVGDFYAVNTLGSGPIFDANAIEVDAGDFEVNALGLNALGPTIGHVTALRVDLSGDHWAMDLQNLQDALLILEMANPFATKPLVADILQHDADCQV